MPAAPRSLSERFDPARNNLGLMRLLLAATVIVVHVESLTIDDQPNVFKADLGGMAVDGFFILSGFLVTRSALRLDSVRRFAWHRALRILPGFWVCLLVTALLVAPLLAVLEGRPPLSVLSGRESSINYVVNNSALLMRQYGIAGLRGEDHMAGVLDGSLWSLYYEAFCYAAVAALVLVGVLVTRPIRVGGRHAQQPLRLLVHRRALMVIAMVVLWVSLVADDFDFALPLHMGRQLVFIFLIGALAELYGEHIPMDWRLAVLAAGVLLGGCYLAFSYYLIGGLAFGYLLLWLAVAAPMAPQPRADLSYGVYMYHWPIAAILIELGLGSAGLVVMMVCTAVLTLGAAAASWFWIESPALRFKNARWVQRPALRSRTLTTPTTGVPVRGGRRVAELADR